jgi:hypothetical protein
MLVRVACLLCPVPSSGDQPSHVCSTVLPLLFCLQKCRLESTSLRSDPPAALGQTQPNPALTTSLQPLQEPSQASAPATAHHGNPPCCAASRVPASTHMSNEPSYLKSCYAPPRFACGKGCMRRRGVEREAFRLGFSFRAAPDPVRLALAFALSSRAPTHALAPWEPAVAQSAEPQARMRPQTPDGRHGVWGVTALRPCDRPLPQTAGGVCLLFSPTSLTGATSFPFWYWAIWYYR